MQSLGFSYEEVEKLNPRIIYASISGFGQEGVYANRPLLDPVAQAMSGLMSVTGPADGEQVRCGASVCDVLAAQNAVIAILAALEYRRTSGHGQYIDVSLIDSSPSPASTRSTLRPAACPVISATSSRPVPPATPIPPRTARS